VNFEKIGNINDYHRINKRNQKKLFGCINQTAKRFIIITTILLTIGILITLSVLLIKPNKHLINREANLRWNRTGITIAGNTSFPGTENNQLNAPLGATVDYQNTLYIADTSNSRIQKYVMDAKYGITVAGNANGTAGSNLSELRFPSQVLVSSNGYMFVADRNNHRVMLWRNSSTSGEIVAGVGTNANNTLSSPYQMDYHQASESLYVSDYANSRIMHFKLGTPSGTMVAGTGVNAKNYTHLMSPVGVHFESLSNNLIITNNFGHNIVRWPLGATSWTLVAGDINGNSGTDSKRFNLPTVTTLDPMGNFYVADRNNQRIQLFMNGQLEGITIAGVVNTTGSNSTLLSTPWSVALDNQLNLYVADAANHRVQKFLRY